MSKNTEAHSPPSSQKLKRPPQNHTISDEMGQLIKTKICSNCDTGLVEAGRLSV